MEKKVKDFHSQVEELSTLSEQKLLHRLLELQDVYTTMTRQRMLNMDSWIEVEEETQDLFEEHNLPFEEKKLTSGIEHETAKMNAALRNLAELHGTSSFDSAFQNFLDRFGHFESEGVSLRENKETILHYIEELEQSDHSPNTLEKRKQEFEKYMDDLLEDVQDDVRGEVEEAVEKYRSAIKLREDSKTLQDLPKPIINRIVKEIGKKLVENDKLSDASDVWLLTLEELKEGEFDRQDIKTRKKIIKEKRKNSWLPDWFREDGEEIKGNIMDGIAGSSGSVGGPVKIVSGPDEFDKVKQGDIVIAHSTNPMWTQLFSIIAGIVVEHGTVLSHAAITAREYEIPCVVGVKDATQILKGGDEVEVDADEGVVKIIFTRRDNPRL